MGRTSKSMEALPDILLIERYLNGEAECFDELYRRYKLPVYAYLNRLLGDPAIADDIFQQTWFKAIRHLPKYRCQQKFIAWITRVAHNLAIDHFRSRKAAAVDVSLDDENFRGEPPAAEDKPWAQMDRVELSAAIEEGLGRLPIEQREVFLLRQDDVSFKDIASTQGVSINTALGRMRYALMSLRQYLSGRGVNSDG